MNILIVEDNANDRKLLRQTLGHHGCTVIEARDGEEGLNLANRHHPDIIVSDALMPRMDGFQLLRALKADPYLKSIPFLFYSAIYTGEQEVKLALSLGAEAFVAKSTEPEELWEKTCAIMQAWEARQKMPAHVNIVESEEEYLREYSRIVATKLENKVRELEEANKLAENELSRVNAELTREITERKRSEETLRESEEVYRSLVENIDFGVTMIDKDFKIIMTNAVLGKWFNKPAFEFAGKNCFKEFEKRQGICKHCPAVKAMADGRPRQVDTDGVRDDGSRFSVRVHAFPLFYPDGAQRGFIEVIEDISERKLREQEQTIILSMTTALRKAATSGELMRISLEQLAGFMNCQGAAIAMCDNETGEMVVEHTVGCWADRNGVRFSMDDMLFGQPSANGQAILISDPQNNSRFAESHLSDKIRSMVCIPLVAQQQTIGALIAGYDISPMDHETRILEEVGDIVANATSRALLHEQTVRQLQQLSALRAIDTAINASMDLSVTFRIILEEVIHQLRVDAAAVLLLNKRTQTLKYTAGVGFRSVFPQGAQLRVGVGHAGRAALERSIVSVANLSQDTGGFTVTNLLSGEGFVSYLALPLVAKGEVKGILEIFRRAPLIIEREWLDFLNTLVGQAAIAIGGVELFNDLQRSNTELILAYDATIEGWSRALDMRDKETEGHSRRVTEMTLMLAVAMEMSENELVHVRRGALLHDIGKMGIPDNILLKPGPLTPEEWEVMRKHPVYAREMLSPITFLKHALDIPCFHHEKWDGTGYPEGLRGERIPLPARIFSVVDVWDALVSDRSYRPAWPEDKAREYLREEAGKSFDPKVVDMFLAAGIS